MTLSLSCLGLFAVSEFFIFTWFTPSADVICRPLFLACLYFGVVVRFLGLRSQLHCCRSKPPLPIHTPPVCLCVTTTTCLIVAVRFVCSHPEMDGKGKPSSTSWVGGRSTMRGGRTRETATYTSVCVRVCPQTPSIHPYLPPGWMKKRDRDVLINLC